MFQVERRGVESRVGVWVLAWNQSLTQTIGLLHHYVPKNSSEFLRAHCFSTLTHNNKSQSLILGLESESGFLGPQLAIRVLIF